LPVRTLIVEDPVPARPGLPRYSRRPAAWFFGGMLLLTALALMLSAPLGLSQADARLEQAIAD
jgi:hypothetical protein